jgi:hypothetical protein
METSATASMVTSSTACSGPRLSRSEETHLTEIESPFTRPNLVEVLESLRTEAGLAMIGPGRIAGDQVVADDLRAIARAQLSDVLNPFASEDPLRGPPVNRGVERPLLCSAPDFCSGSIAGLQCPLSGRNSRESGGSARGHTSITRRIVAVRK